MAVINATARQRKFTIPANDETKINFPEDIQSFDILNLSTNTLFFRFDGGDATLNDDDSIVLAPQYGLGYTELFSRGKFRTISIITATESDVQITRRF